jgi:uncharacterized protein YbjQ (UPF0145 family)
MRISFTQEIEGGRVLYPIGRIRAASGWRAGAAAMSSDDCKAQALERLIAAASDYEADAIIGVDYEVDGAKIFDLAAVPVERVTATGIAVKLAKA